MSDFVNKIKTKDGTEYSIQDQRLSVTAEDAGKMVSVDNEGNLTLVDAPSGGIKLYKHDIELELTLNGSTTKYITHIELITTRQLQILDNSSIFYIVNAANHGDYIAFLGSEGPVVFVTAISSISYNGHEYRYVYSLDNFNPFVSFHLSGMYPGSNLSVHMNDEDEIDLSTGKLNTNRVDLINSSTVDIISDTVTEL